MTFDLIYLFLNLLQSFQHVLDRSPNVANQVLLKDFVQQRSFGRTVQFFAAITQHLLKLLHFRQQLMQLTILLHFQLLVSQTIQATNKENQVIELLQNVHLVILLGTTLVTLLPFFGNRTFH